MATISIAEINRRNREFWELHQHDPESGLESYEISHSPVNQGLLLHHLDLLTKEMKRCGAQDRQLEATHFRVSPDLPLDLWPWRAPLGLPESAIPLAHRFCILKHATQDSPLSCITAAAWQLVGEAITEPLVALALQTRQKQRERAQKSRGMTADGCTIREIIAVLVRSPENREATAPELWPRLFAALEECALDPAEAATADQDQTRAYTYQGAKRRRQITFGRFATIVSELRKSSSR